MPFLGQQPTEVYKSTAKQTITGDGSTSYTLDNAVTSGTDLEVFVNNVRQEPGTDYSASGNTITFTTAVESSDSCWLVYQGKAFTTTSIESDNLADGSVTNAKISGVAASKLTGALDVNASAPADSLAIDASGNVGIGTTPATDWRSNITGLQIGNSGSIFARNDSGETKTFINENVKWTADAQEYINNGPAAQHQMDAGIHTFKVAPSGTADTAINWTSAMQIASNGDLYFGETFTSAPWNATSGSGGYYYNDYGTLWLMCKDNYGLALNRTNSTGNIIKFYRGGTIVGDISVTSSSTSYNTSSDYRLKENVVDMTGSIDRVKALQPRRFNWITDEDDTTVDGFLAHEVSDIIPEAISGEKDATREEEYEVTPAVLDDDGNVITEAVMGTRTVPDYQGIDQSKLVPLLTGALQEAIAKIEALETRIETLENA